MILKGNFLSKFDDTCCNISSYRLFEYSKIDHSKGGSVIQCNIFSIEQIDFKAYNFEHALHRPVSKDDWMGGVWPNFPTNFSSVYHAPEGSVH